MRHDVGKVLSSAVSAIPQIDTQQVEKMFDDSVHAIWHHDVACEY